MSTISTMLFLSVLMTIFSSWTWLSQFYCS